MRNRRPGVLLVTILLISGFTWAQTWQPISDSQVIPVRGARDIIPNLYRMYKINTGEMKDLLWSAPPEYAQTPSGSNVMIRVALADGTVDIFRIVKYDMMEALLAATYSDIKTFRGVSISNPYRTLRADWTDTGFRAVVREPGVTMYIDPYQRNDQEFLIAYYKEDFITDRAFQCGVLTDGIKGEDHADSRVFGDCMFRSYRLALATSGEYSNYFGATSPAQASIVLSQVVTAINRVNDVYEADIAVRLILIGNTTSIFYYDPAGDPFSGDACTQLGQNQSNTNSVIGSANYDVGHVFSVGSGGCAGLGVICSTSNKARGATGLNPPTGDPFYIDYVSHELGHQFGGAHTFNGTAGSCGGGNREPTSAYEPGSGTTIMAYAGICGAQDLQPHSDDYFHARSLLQIASKVTSTSCAAFIATNNTAPVANNVPNYTIPVSTPFVLTADASDPENDSLSYCWEEYDLEATSTEPPAANDIDGPMFRSWKATTSPKRYFPRLEDLTQNTTSIWEVLPSVSRTMTFRMTVRDYHDIAGCTAHDDVVVTTSAASGPFVVTSQNSAVTWLEGSSQTITWNVANTTGAPVSCANVNIFLSYDGGFTYPVTLLMNTPNDGSANVTIPIGTTTMGRVMVRGAGNVFFDINNANITIEANLPNFTLSLDPMSLTECNDGSVQTIVNVGKFLDFSDPVSLTLFNVPPGANFSFSPSVVIPGNSSTLTISNLEGLFGNYISIVRGTSTTGNKDANFNLTLLPPTVAAPMLTSPSNNATDAVITPILKWQIVSGGTQYAYEIAYDNTFQYIVSSGTTITNQTQIITPLLVNQGYYWRVRTENACGFSDWSTPFSFTTGSCFALTSTDVPVIIPATGTPTVTSTFNNNIEMVINDINVINLMGAHSWVNDLKFTLISPQGTSRLFWNQPCANNDDFNINFDDEAPAGTWPCPPTDGLTYQPDNSLSIFDGQQASGVWTLQIQDMANQDGGSLNAWGLKVCGTIGCQLIVNQASGTGTGSLSAVMNCAHDGDIITLSAVLTGQTINIGASPVTLNKSVTFVPQGPGITITGNGARVFEIAAGKEVHLSGISIVAGTAMSGGAIRNFGHLHLDGVNIERNNSITGATLLDNRPGGSLDINGDCTISQ